MSDTHPPQPLPRLRNSIVVPAQVDRLADAGPTPVAVGPVPPPPLSPHAVTSAHARPPAPTIHRDIIQALHPRA